MFNDILTIGIDLLIIGFIFRFPGLPGRKGERGFKGQLGVAGDSRDGRPGNPGRAGINGKFNNCLTFWNVY